MLKTTPKPNMYLKGPTDYVTPEDPNTSKLIVSHCDCAKQHNLRQCNLLNLQQGQQAPSNIQHTKTQATVYVPAKSKRISAFKCEAYVKTHWQWCTRPRESVYRTDRIDWYTNSLELPEIIDPLDCKKLIRYLNGTNSPELKNYDYPTVLPFFDDVTFQRKIEQHQTPFTV